MRGNKKTNKQQLQEGHCVYCYSFAIYGYPRQLKGRTANVFSRL